jgi:excisionase family DNA binding protein
VSRPPRSSPWLDLNEAAEYLGVHFTTLRRWADQGRVPSIRTPGGRRRFNRAELALFLATLRAGETLTPRSPGLQSPLHISFEHPTVKNQAWYARLDAGIREAMREEGQQLLAVLVQYATHSNGGDLFLQEGKRLAVQYGQTCRRARLSLADTVRAFVAIRRTLSDSLAQAGQLHEAEPATWRIYDRMHAFLDVMLISILDGFEKG